MSNCVYRALVLNWIKNHRENFTMSIEKARAYLREYGLDGRIQEFDVSSAKEWSDA